MEKTYQKVSTDLQWLGLSTEPKTVSFQKLWWDTAWVHAYFKNYWIWQLVLDGVVDMGVDYKANDLGSKHYSGVFLSYFILHGNVGLKLLFM